MQYIDIIYIYKCSQWFAVGCGVAEVRTWRWVGGASRCCPCAWW